MIDTLTLSVPVAGVDLDVLHKERGWGVRTWAQGDAFNAYGICNTADGVRLTFIAGPSWLTVECSLPKLLMSRNDVILSWEQVGQAVEAMWETAAGELGQRLPDVGEAHISRVDPVHGWNVDPAPYLASLRLARVKGTEPVLYPAGISWQTTKGHRVRARSYDKSIEQGSPAENPLRFEVQAVPRRQRIKIDGKPMCRKMAELTPSVVRSLLADALHQTGLDTPTPTAQAAKARIFAAYSPTQARLLWAAIRDRQELGRWPAELSRTSKYRYESMAIAAGVLGVSFDVPLAGLTLEAGTNCPESHATIRPTGRTPASSG